MGYDSEFGFGSSNQVGNHAPHRSASAPRLEAVKEEIEGSRPKKWKPARAPIAPPGGGETFHPQDGRCDVRMDGRKRFPDMGAGNNRDPNAIEALRFFRDEERLGKANNPQVKHKPTQQARDSHRFYLTPGDNVNSLPRKGRGSEAGESNVARLLHSSQHPEPVDHLPSPCDSLPLGADWSELASKYDDYQYSD